MTFEYQTTEEHHEILSDLPRFCRDARIMGSAMRFDGDDHLVVRLRILPTIRYFLKEKDDGSEEYVLYSGMSRDRDSVRYFNSVGCGEKMSDEFIKIKFHDLNLICYLRMHPKDQSMRSPAA